MSGGVRDARGHRCATFRDFAYIARPPLAAQLAVFKPLAVVARLLGYRLPYPYPYPRRREAGPRATLAGRRPEKR